MLTCMATAMGTNRSIERRLRALEKRYPRKMDFHGVSMEDLVALESAFAPGGTLDGIQPRLSKRLMRLITKLESEAQ